MYGGNRGYSSGSSRLTAGSCIDSAATSELLALLLRHLWLERSPVPHIPFLAVAMQSDWGFARRLVSVESHASTDPVGSSGLSSSESTSSCIPSGTSGQRSSLIAMSSDWSFCTSWAANGLGDVVLSQCVELVRARVRHVIEVHEVAQRHLGGSGLERLLRLREAIRELILAGHAAEVVRHIGLLVIHEG